MCGVENPCLPSHLPWWRELPLCPPAADGDDDGDDAEDDAQGDAEDGAGVSGPSLGTRLLLRRP